MFSLAVTVMLAVHCYRNCEEKTADSPTVRIYSPLLEKGKKTVHLTSGFKLFVKVFEGENKLVQQ